MGKISRRIDYLNKILNEENLTKQAYPVFKSNTPVKSGNARRNTSKQKNSIKANYAYAGKLDDGYSNQSPKGMTRPTIDHLQAYIEGKIK